MSVSITRAVVAFCLVALATAWGGDTGTGRIHPGVWHLIAEQGESAAVWVFFADKGLHSPEGRRAALARLADTYHPRAVERRRLRRTSPGLFDERDIPVSAEYCAQVAATGAETRVTSSWLNAISVDATAGEILATTFPDCDLNFADMNGDRAVNGADIDRFFDCLGSGNCP